MNRDELAHLSKEIKSKLFPAELAQYCEDLNRFTKFEDRKFILKLWKDLIVCREVTEPGHIKQQEYLSIMEKLDQFRKTIS